MMESKKFNADGPFNMCETWRERFRKRYGDRMVTTTFAARDILRRRIPFEDKRDALDWVLQVHGVEHPTSATDRVLAVKPKDRLRILNGILRRGK